MNAERDIIILESSSAKVDVAGVPYWKLYLINLRHSLAAIVRAGVIVAFWVVLPALLFKFTPEPYFGKIVDVYIGAVFGTPILLAACFVMSLPSLLFVYLPLTAVFLGEQRRCRAYMLLAFIVFTLTGILSGFLFRSIEVSVLMVLFFVVMGPFMGRLHYKLMYKHFEKYPPK